MTFRTNYFKGAKVVVIKNIKKSIEIKQFTLKRVNRLSLPNIIRYTVPQICYPIKIEVPKSWCTIIKARANARNIVGQQDATLLGPTCCEHLHTMLCVVATCWKLLDEVWNWLNLIQQLPTKRDNTQHGVQTLATCWAQQCCECLHGPLLIFKFGPEHAWRIWLVTNEK